MYAKRDFTIIGRNGESLHQIDCLINSIHSVLPSHSLSIVPRSITLILSQSPLLPPLILFPDTIQKKPSRHHTRWKRGSEHGGILSRQLCVIDFSQNKSSATLFYVAMLSTVFEAAVSDLCPSSAPFFGFMGVAASIIFASRFLMIPT